MIELDIDMNELAFAWQDIDCDSTYYLDTDTGSLVLVRPDLDELHELREDIELQPGRFLFVPKPTQNQLDLDLMDFIYTIACSHSRSMIELALEAPNKYATLRAVLSKIPGETERWQEWSMQGARQRALRWLEAQGLCPLKK